LVSLDFHSTSGVSGSEAFPSTQTFSPSETFGPTRTFSPSIEFTLSDAFTSSSGFTRSQTFSPSGAFAATQSFASSASFSSSLSHNGSQALLVAVVGGGNNAADGSNGLVGGIAGSLAGLVALTAAFLLFFIKRKRADEVLELIGDEMDDTEGVDASMFSSDEGFVSEYGFSDKASNSERGEGGSGGVSDDEILVSEYGVSEGHQVSRGSEGAVEDLEDSLGDEPDGESMADDDGGE
jgi:hypothetical protein